MKFMISPRDSLTLAVTKLRVRRIRLGITLAVMSLLFAGLVLTSILVSGAIESAKTFSKEGLGGRFIVQAQPYSYMLYDNGVLQDGLAQQQATLVAQKTALAKKYSIIYDSKTDTSLPITTSQYGSSSSDTNTVINPTSQLAANALAQQNSRFSSGYSDFIKLAKQSGATTTYRSTVPDYGGSGSTTNISVLLDGKEDYTLKKDANYGEPTGVKSITSLGWNQMSDDLLQPFLLDGQSTKIGADGSIPIAAPLSAAMAIAGLDKLPDTAGDQQKIDQLQAVRQKVAGKTVNICYRNDTSTALLQKAIAQQTEISNNKSKKDYTPPALQYSLPTEACGAVVVKKDSRSTDEKISQTRQDELDAITTPKISPVQGLFSVRIVGITADTNTGGSSLSAGAILLSILQSNLGQGWLSPVSAFQLGSIPTQAQGGLVDAHSLVSQVYYAEFPTLSAAQAFIKDQTCDTSKFDKNQSYNPNGIADHCKASHQNYIVSAFGNNAGAIADFQNHVWKYLRFVLLAIIVIAVFVMIGTLGKIIADSRRETAVFRALGARRLHISQIYLTYSLLLGGMIIGLSFAIGSVAAGIVNLKFESSLSTSAVMVYNARDINQRFSIFSLDWRYIGMICIIILSTSLVATALPLLLNMRRNPIRDMREE